MAGLEQREGSLGEEARRRKWIWPHPVGQGRNLALPRRWVAASVCLFVKQECAFPFRDTEAPGEAPEVSDWAASTVGQDSLNT